MKKQFIQSRVYKQDKEFFNNIAFELSLIEKKRVSFPEVVRRIKNIPNLTNVLRTDSKLNKTRWGFR